MKKSKILYAASTASHLRRFHKPYLEALSAQEQVLTMANGEGVDFCIPFSKSFFSLANLRCVFLIRRILKKERFDRVILNTSLTAFLVRAAMIGLRCRPYVLNVVHGYLFQMELRGFTDRFLLFCEKLMRRKTDDIAVMNEDDFQIATRYRLCRGQVFKIFGMGLPESPTLEDSACRVREEFGIKQDDLLVLFIGELSGRKNQAFLISCIDELSKRGVEARLLLLGEGNDRKKLEQMILKLDLQEKVFLAGNREPVTPYLAAADLYASASISEGLPFNILEAMDAGLPILASDTKGQTDLLSAYEGCLYPLHDERDFCEALIRLLASRSHGVKTRSYPSLAKYRLSAVFDDNMKILTRGADHHEIGN